MKFKGRPARGLFCSQASMKQNRRTGIGLRCCCFRLNLLSFGWVCFQSCLAPGSASIFESFPPGAFSACSMHACQANRKASSANRKTASQQSLRSSNWCFDQANRRGLPSSRPSGFWFFLFSVEHTEQTKSARKQPDSGRKRRLTCEVD